MQQGFVHIDPFLFALIQRTDIQIRNILCIHLRNIHFLRVSNLRSYRANVQIESHHTIRNMFCWIKVTSSGFLFGPLPHITLIRQLLRFLNNLLDILHTDISNGIPCLFVILRPSNNLETQRGHQPLSWYSPMIFWFWIFYFYPLQSTKIQRDVQGDVILTVLDIPVFLTLRLPYFFMFTGVNFSSQNVFQVEQPW